ncbi:biliverdin-producing heme oxygenase [Henriciella marina]|uniref:biliverdin-producing heme oxygenase n=1 Tax=Henriciella marina TaxID=453851 RepID=UPI00039EA052|nr:biliverdin-producing heme oxygenase [Henriciella marina]
MDALFSQHDLSTRNGLSSVLRAHSVALNRTLSALSNQTSTYAKTLQTMIAAIDEDLKALDEAVPGERHFADPAPDVHPLGLIYVIAGSTLGARILLSDIQASGDPKVAAATRYFACPATSEMWKSVSKTLKCWSGQPHEENKIVTSAQTAFSWFEAAHSTVQKASNDV